MQFDLVFIGLSTQAQPVWTSLSDQIGARAWFFDDVSSVQGLRFADVDIMVSDFVSRSDFKELRHKYAEKGGGMLSVAILEEPSFELCAEAFRAGATDVIAMPPTNAGMENLIKQITSVALKTLHPDAVLPLEIVEKVAIRAALSACNGQISKTSRKLGIGRSTLYRKLELYDLLERS
jgi:DNA-binding NtrC family response regulator